jgi:hypothetical protein
MAQRITVHERESSIEVTLEGRLADPSMAELSNTWRETAPRPGRKTLAMNPHKLTYSNEGRKQLLRKIVAQTSAAILTSDPLMTHFAQEIRTPEAN